MTSSDNAEVTNVGRAQCFKCFEPASEDATFCGKCGEQLKRKCSACTSSNPATSNFCFSCGKGLAEAATKPDKKEASRLAAEAEDLLDGTVTRLTAARKTIKEKEWELVECRRRLDQFERERTTQDRRRRELETALERQSHAQSEAERRCSEVQADAEAAQQRGELRRQLVSAELARDRALEDAMEGARREVHLEQRVVDLEARLADCHAQLLESQAAQEDLEQRLKRASKEKSGSTSTGDTQREQRVGEQKPTRQSLGGVLPRSSFGAAARPHTRAVQHSEGHSKSGSERCPSSDSLAECKAHQIGVLPRSGFGAAARPPPKVRHSEGGVQANLNRCPSSDLHSENEGLQQPTLARPASLQSMPTNLMSLGKLLAGSGVMNKGKT